ncbi:hypothetical protein RM553_06230 [Zunongwangia sp. F363]|uniref:CarboxypepD_reg-like domain-containing protein n=1 Tax=Autumnicola tepida TaxID=3075595 RepID=A0ABU3C7V3_9FLAO|nr:hypothetical protein [Zunongwangia sp. F363]MDT0642426.1 hypothetical protein [Zunongwangia sp. F363]
MKEFFGLITTSKVRLFLFRNFKTFFVGFLFLFPVLMYGQESILLEGKILNDSLDGSFINIINKNTGTGTINSASGNFSIRVRKGDTLEFSAIQYKKLEVVITALTFEAAYLEVELLPGLTELDEVKISNISLTGNLAGDIGDIEVNEVPNYGLKRRNVRERTLSERKMTVYGGSPVDLLLGHLNGEIKMLKKLRENEKLYALVEKARDIAPASYYLEELNLKESMIMNYLYYCAETYSLKPYLEEGMELEFMQFLKKHASEFLDLQDLD